MNNTILMSTALVLTVMLSACAREEKAEGVIPAGYKSALEKAEGVEGKLEDAMQMQAREIDKSDD